jgi:predicted MFS family arabinose efflux permease
LKKLLVERWESASFPFTHQVSMSIRQLKIGYYALTALNTLATSYYLNYLFFFLRDHFGFGNRENLWVSALHGFIYIFSAWQCGKFAQRHGFHTSLKLGFAGLTLCMVTGALFNSALGNLVALIGYSIVLLFTWPALEALTSENEAPDRVPHMVGVYNCVWSSAAALAYFTGGKLYDLLGAGAVFWLPAAIFFGQLLFAGWLSHQAKKFAVREMKSVKPVEHHPEAAAFRQPVGPRTFLKLAWLANPLAYVAVNTLFAVMPGLAQKLGVWLFGRLAAFVLLWQWTGWHYRFRWLAVGFVVLIASFAAILLSIQLWIVVFAQIFFGLAAGLMYYSSLFYSMDAGDTKGEHGGLHEAAIGAGVCAGTTVGAAALQFFPQHPNAGAIAVSGLLVAGFCALLAIWGKSRLRSSPGKN